MSDTIIQVSNLGKKYIIGHKNRESYNSLRDVIAEATRSIGKKLTIKKNNFNSVHTREEFWALEDISFTVKQGDVLGIIGRNGAGKSTLLKILSRITEPTTGEILLNGRVASLLEVGTGFHPELTGRENIYLNGAILGMTRIEIKRKFDEIVDFAEIEKFLDTPVKRYSSGMYVRLAFAVAAHLEPEVLVVDEVLAVGDIEFQKKCLGKMGDVAAKEGRTVLFVSHNMSAINSLCKQGLLLSKGKLVEHGPISQVIKKYTDYVSSEDNFEWRGFVGDETIKLLRTWVKTLDSNNQWHTAAEIEIGVEIEVFQELEGLILGFRLFSEDGDQLAYVLYDDAETSDPPKIYPGKIVGKFKIPANTLALGAYRINFDVGIHRVKAVIPNEPNADGTLKFSLDNYYGLGTRFIVPRVRGYTSHFRPNWSTKSQLIELRQRD